jgi:putative protease
VACARGEITVRVTTPLVAGDGVGFEPPDSAAPARTIGFTIDAIRTVDERNGVIVQVITTRSSVPTGWRVVRSYAAALSEAARASFATTALPDVRRRRALDVRVFGAPGAPLKAVFSLDGDAAVVTSDAPLVPATNRSLDLAMLRAQFGRLGETDFALGAVDYEALVAGLFLPVSELNRMRQRAVTALGERRAWTSAAADAERAERIAGAVRVDATRAPAHSLAPFALAANVYSLDDARAALGAGATEIVVDPFLRHPLPPRARLRAFADDAGAQGVVVRLRTPTIVRPEERRALEPWLALGLPILSGHTGLAVECAATGHEVVADYGVNAFNAHTVAELFGRGIARVVASVELTAGEIAELAAPWGGRGIDVVIYGRPEGMTIEHCVLSAAFDREVTTCRVLCVQKHPQVELTDPAGYTFPVATDSACRNRLLHSRPIEASEFVPALWSAGIRGFHMLFNVPGDPVAALVARYRALLDELHAGRAAPWAAVRELVGHTFTRGHFARAV